MTRRSGQNRAALVVVAILAVTAALTSQPMAPVARSYESTDYGSAGYRAWAALLSREGLTTSRFLLRPIELDDRIDTLISAQPLPLSADASVRTAADLAALAAWVRAGGHLVYLGRNALLRESENRSLELPFALPNVGARGPASGPLVKSTGPLRGLGTNRMLFVEHPGNVELADANGDIVVRYPLGHGDVRAVVDGTPFTNANITGPGNARLAVLLASPRRPGSMVAFDDGLHGALVDRPWYRALPLALRVSLGILALAALLGLVGGTLRTGPAVRLEPPREPTSAEFVTALAALYERVHARPATGALLARQAFAIAARGAGGNERLAPAELAARIADPARADNVRRLAEVLATPVTTDAALVAGARLAYTVRKDWTHDGYRDGRRAAFAGRTRARRRR